MTEEATEYLSKTDKRLGRLIRKVGPCGLKRKNHRSPFEALVESVVYQQLNGTAAATILGRVKALYTNRRFPTPADLLNTPDHQLRGAGLSRAKTAALKDIAAKQSAGFVSLYCRAKRCRNRRAAHGCAWCGALDRRDAADFYARPPGRPSGDRLRREKGVRPHLRLEGPAKTKRT